MAHRTPLYDWHLARGGRAVPFAGWDMPVQYAGVVAEHTAVRTAAGLFDISHMARVDVTGPAALALLEDVFTNAVGTMAAGQVRYGLICNETGGILDDVLVTRWPDGFSVVVNAGNREKIAAWMAERNTAFGATLTDHTFTTAMLAVQGPKAVGVVSRLMPAEVAALKYYFALRTTYRGHPCVVSRTGYTGEDGFELIVPNELATPLADEILGMGVVPCGLGARDTLRLEAAMPLYGHELNESVDPISAGLGWAVKVAKGPFVGRDAIQRVLASGPTRLRVGLVLDGKRAAREGCPILVNNIAVGTVTSGSFAPHVQKAIAMGYVPAAAAAPGTPLTIDIRGTATPAAVVPLPFYKRAK